jgi:hypothetical protein
MARKPYLTLEYILALLSSASPKMVQGNPIH